MGEWAGMDRTGMRGWDGCRGSHWEATTARHDLCCHTASFYLLFTALWEDPVHHNFSWLLCDLPMPTLTHWHTHTHMHVLWSSQSNMNPQLQHAHLARLRLPKLKPRSKCLCLTHIPMHSSDTRSWPIGNRYWASTRWQLIHGCVLWSFPGIQGDWSGTTAQMSKSVECLSPLHKLI